MLDLFLKMNEKEYFFNTPTPRSPIPVLIPSPSPNHQFIRLLSTSRHGYAKFEFLITRVVSIDLVHMLYSMEISLGLA